LCEAVESQKKTVSGYVLKLQQERTAAQKKLTEYMRAMDGARRKFVAAKETAWDQKMAQQKASHQKELQDLKEVHRQQILKGGPGHLKALLSDSMLEANLVHQLKQVYSPDESLRTTPGSSAGSGSPVTASATTAHPKSAKKVHFTPMTSTELKQAVRPELGTEGPALGSTDQERGLLVEAVKRGIVVPPALRIQHVEAVASAAQEVESPTYGLYKEFYDWSDKIVKADEVRDAVRSEVETALAKELAPAAEGDNFLKVDVLPMDPTASAATVTESAVVLDSSTYRGTAFRHKSALSLAIANMRRDKARRREAPPIEAQPNETWRQAYWNGTPAPMSGAVGDAGGAEHVEQYPEDVELAAPVDVPAAILSGRTSLIDALDLTYRPATVDVRVAKGFDSSAGVVDLYDSVELAASVDVPTAILSGRANRIDALDRIDRAAVVDVSIANGFMSSADDVDLYDSVEIGTVVDVPATLVDVSGGESDSWVQVEHEVYESSVSETEDETTSQAEDSSHYDSDDEVTSGAEE